MIRDTHKNNRGQRIDALNTARRPTEVTTDRAPAYPRVLDEVVPAAWHTVEQYANNPIETDHGRLQARTRLMRGVRRIRGAQVVSGGHAFVQNLRHGHYELGLDTEPGRRLEPIFTELAPRDLSSAFEASSQPFSPQRNSAGPSPGTAIHGGFV
jgi:DDE domain